MKKIPIWVAFLLLLSVAALPTANSFSGCPESWETKMPNVKFETYPGTKLRYISYDGDVRKGMEYQTFRLVSYYPELSNYVKSLGPDAVVNFEFEISDKPDFKSKMLLKGDYQPYAYQIDYTEFNTLYGIPSDPWIRTSITVEVKSCKPSKFYSNSIQAKNNYMLENLDAYFLQFRSFFYNFKQEDLLRKALVKNYRDLSNPILLKALLGNERYEWKTEDDVILSPYTAVSFNGLSPMGCLKKAASRELTRVISFNALPCKVGVFFHNERGFLVQVMDFEAPTLIQTVKPVPSPAPSQSTQPAVVTSKTPIPPKKTTITCVKGKTAKNVTAVQPKCPSGYKVKK